MAYFNDPIVASGPPISTYTTNTPGMAQPINSRYGANGWEYQDPATGQWLPSPNTDPMAANGISGGISPLMPYNGGVIGPGFPGSGQSNWPNDPSGGYTAPIGGGQTSLQPSMPNAVPGSVQQFWQNQFQQPTTGTAYPNAGAGLPQSSQLPNLQPMAGGGTVQNQQQALMTALGMGLQGQAAVDWVQQNYPQFNQYGSGIEWQPSSGTFGVPGGYFAPNSSGQFGFVPRTEGAGGGSPYGTGSFGSLMSGYPGFNAPGSAQFSFSAPSTNVSSLPSWAQPYTQQYSLPTAEQARQTPGYQFALQQGLQAVDQGAAAKGSLRTGGTLKAEQQYGQGLADTTYQNAVQNSLAQFGTNYGVYQGNQAAAAGAYQQMFNNALSTFGANTGAYQQAFNNALAAYGTNFGVSNTLANNQFNWNAALANLGMGANNALTAAGNNYGNNLSQLYQGIGNANAAGTIGSNNAVNNGINNALAAWYPFLYGL